MILVQQRDVHEFTLGTFKAPEDMLNFGYRIAQTRKDCLGSIYAEAE